MRNTILILATASVLALSSSPAVPAASPSPVDNRQIVELITQLGSARFKEREAATRALEALGGPALEALERAALSNDPEVGRRAQNLAHTIRRRLETARFLAPLRLRLVYRETPVLQAVEDFAKKAEFPIEIVNSRARLANRKITLDTGETSFWEAFTQFGQAAGLVERTANSESDLHTHRLLDASLRGPRGVVQIVEGPSSSLGSARAWDGRLILADGQPPPLPTDYAGAVRIRALPASGTAKDDILFCVEMTPQPKTALHNVVDLRIDKAVDENGQDLAPLMDTRSEFGRLATLGNGVMLWDAQTGQPVTTSRDIPVRLKSGDKPSGILKEVKGVVAAQVQTEPQAIITVDHVFKSVGRTFLGDEGESLKLSAADRQPNGDVHLRIELTDATSANALWAIRGGVLRPNRLGRRALAEVDSNAQANLVLQDANGQSLPLRGRTEGMLINGNCLVREIRLIYHSGLSEPSKLVYSGRRTLVIEIPFTLKDVPMP